MTLIKEMKQIFEEVKYFNQQQLTLPTNCKDGKNIFIIFISFILLACVECDDSLPFSGASSIPLLCTFSSHPYPTILPSSLTSSCHLFLGLPLSLLVPKFIYNTLLAILFSSILCTCPNQCNLCKCL